jgi:hypothetical protein
MFHALFASELVRRYALQGTCVADLCSGSGTGVAAACLEGYDALAIDTDSKQEAGFFQRLLKVQQGVHDEFRKMKNNKIGHLVSSHVWGHRKCVNLFPSHAVDRATPERLAIRQQQSDLVADHEDFGIEVDDAGFPINYDRSLTSSYVNALSSQQVPFGFIVQGFCARINAPRMWTRKMPLKKFLRYLRALLMYSCFRNPSVISLSPPPKIQQMVRSAAFRTHHPFRFISSVNI